MEMMILFGTLGRRKRGGELQNGSRCLFGQVQGYESLLWAGHICAIIPSNTHKNKLVTSAGLTFSGNSNHNPPFRGPSFQASWRQVLRSHETPHPRPVYAHAPGFGGVASSCFLHRLMCLNSVCVLSSLATSGLGQSLFR